MHGEPGVSAGAALPGTDESGRARCPQRRTAAPGAAGALGLCPACHPHLLRAGREDPPRAPHLQCQQLPSPGGFDFSKLSTGINQALPICWQLLAGGWRVVGSRVAHGRGNGTKCALHC